MRREKEKRRALSIVLKIGFLVLIPFLAESALALRYKGKCRKQCSLRIFRSVVLAVVPFRPWRWRGPVPLAPLLEGFAWWDAFDVTLQQIKYGILRNSKNNSVY